MAIEATTSRLTIRQGGDGMGFTVFHEENGNILTFQREHHGAGKLVRFHGPCTYGLSLQEFRLIAEWLRWKGIEV